MSTLLREYSIAELIDHIESRGQVCICLSAGDLLARADDDGRFDGYELGELNTHIGDILERRRTDILERTCAAANDALDAIWEEEIPGILALWEYDTPDDESAD